MYRAGDITELCELVHPQIGVLTAIGPVHLERMGSIEAIADAKSELARRCPPTATWSPTAMTRACARSPRARRSTPSSTGWSQTTPRSEPSRSRWPTGGPRSRW